MYASRFRDCVCAEQNRIGGAHKKWGSQKLRATLRWEIHAAQEALEAWPGGGEPGENYTLANLNPRSHLR